MVLLIVGPLLVRDIVITVFDCSPLMVHICQPSHDMGTSTLKELWGLAAFGCCGVLIHLNLERGEVSQGRLGVPGGTLRKGRFHGVSR